MMFNQTLTIYNKFHNRETDGDEYFRHVIPFVSVQSKRARTISGKSMVTADFSEIYIRYNDNYRDPNIWARSKNKGALFTIQKGDIILPGECFDEITRLSVFLDEHSALTIMSIKDMNFASRGMRHFEVEAE